MANQVTSKQFAIRMCVGCKRDLPVSKFPAHSPKSGIWVCTECSPEEEEAPALAPAPIKFDPDEKLPLWVEVTNYAITGSFAPKWVSLTEIKSLIQKPLTRAQVETITALGDKPRLCPMCNKHYDAEKGFLNRIVPLCHSCRYEESLRTGTQPVPGATMPSDTTYKPAHQPATKTYSLKRKRCAVCKDMKEANELDQTRPCYCKSCSSIYTRLANRKRRRFEMHRTASRIGAGYWNDERIARYNGFSAEIDKLNAELNRLRTEGEDRLRAQNLRVEAEGLSEDGNTD